MNKFSKITVFAIVFFLAFIRMYYAKWESPTKLNVLTWDAFGYYLYLPGQFIYNDLNKMEWVGEIKEKYQTTGPVYQISTLPNGNVAIKYLAGIAILYSPFFFAGHLIAGWFSFPQDGFSAPYQFFICIAALFYAFLGLWVLRKVLLRYFADNVTALTLLLMALSTNYPQYVSVDSGMTHGFIFALYPLLLVATIRWHQQPTFIKALLIGAIIGLGVVSRPTEGVMLFIPLFYGTQNSISKKEKWTLVRQNRSHIIAAFIGGFVAILPQLIYWKIVSGHWIYDVGSKWSFLQPHWQVLFGWEKGWFIYTPVVVLMVLGIFFFRKNPFYHAVVTFFLLNLWIVMAWSDWRYGASYSCRALVQSYAVMALPMAMVIQKVLTDRLKYIVWSVGIFLIGLNIFQIWQYNKGILHYNDMNRRYYQAIFMNPNPTPLQMSLLDTKEYLGNNNSMEIKQEIKVDSQFMINVVSKPKVILYESELNKIVDLKSEDDRWLLISAKVLSAWGAYETKLSTRLDYGTESKQTDCRMQNGLSVNMEWNKVEYYFKIPSNIKDGRLSIFSETKVEQDIFIKDLSVKIINNK